MEEKRGAGKARLSGGDGPRESAAGRSGGAGKTRLSGGDGEQVSLIEGRNAVLEALRAGVEIDKVYISGGDADSTLRAIASRARAAGAAVSETDRRKLDSMSGTRAHQGVIASVSCVGYASVADILEIARRKGEEPLIVLCDGVTDPHNLGAIIRTSEALGAHGVVIPKHRSAGATATVARTSSGAVFLTAVARVPNLSTAIAELKKSGLWVYGAAAGEGEALWKTDLNRPLALVVGSEGAGISRLVSENCDLTVSIPMFGRMTSLNASVAAAIFIYEVVRQRRLLSKV